MARLLGCFGGLTLIKMCSHSALAQQYIDAQSPFLCLSLLFLFSVSSCVHLIKAHLSLSNPPSPPNRMLSLIRASRLLVRTRIRGPPSLYLRCLHASLHPQDSAPAPASPPAPPLSDLTPPSKEPSKSSKRRLKGHRSGRIGGLRTSQPDSSSKVYVPVIPDTFLATHYHLAGSDPHNLASLPYHIHEGVKTELLNTMASCLLAPHSPQTFIQRMPARHNNILLSSPSEGSSRLLESLTMVAAKRIGADVVTVDMQDLMELTPEMFGKSAGKRLRPQNNNPHYIDGTVSSMDIRNDKLFTYFYLFFYFFKKK